MNLKKFLGLEDYISPPDQFLASWTQAHPELSSSQRQEIAEYQRIYAWRDHPQQEKPPEKLKIWPTF